MDKLMENKPQITMPSSFNASLNSQEAHASTTQPPMFNAQSVVGVEVKI